MGYLSSTYSENSSYPKQSYSQVTFSSTIFNTSSVFHISVTTDQKTCLPIPN